MPNDIPELIWATGVALLLGLIFLVRVLTKNIIDNIKKQISGQGESLDTLRTDVNHKDREVNEKITDVKEDLMSEIHDAKQSMGKYATTGQIETVHLRIDELADKISKCATHDDVIGLHKNYEKNFQKLFTDIGEIKGMLKSGTCD